jgi:hypothetical protein
MAMDCSAFLRSAADPPLNLVLFRLLRLGLGDRSLNESHQLLHRFEMIRAAAIDVLDSAGELDHPRIGLLAKLDHEGAPHSPAIENQGGGCVKTGWILGGIR